MPKRRRLFTPLKNKTTKIIPTKNEDENKSDRANDVNTPRGRLKGALLDVLEPTEYESDTSFEPSPVKKERKRHSTEHEEYSSEDDKPFWRSSPPQQSYVLKLFDRSVELSQFSEDTPLYPICRAWIANNPKANYRDMGKRPTKDRDNIELPGPEGSPVSRIPDLLPEQRAANKDNINLNYREAPPPPRELLLSNHGARWAAVRHAWVSQATRVEARYDATQQALNKLNVEYMCSTR